MCTEAAQRLAKEQQRPFEYATTLTRLGCAELGRGNIGDAQVLACMHFHTVAQLHNVTPCRHTCEAQQDNVDLCLSTKNLD